MKNKVKGLPIWTGTLTISISRILFAKCNFLCKFRVDLMKPANGVQFTLEHFLNSKEDCGLFINFLTDLNKLVAFEQRDAY